jgi:2'-5' RNA ligase
MAFAVSAWFDAALENRVRTIWRLLSESHLSSALHEGPYRPHITLGVYEELDRNAFSGALRRAIRSLRRPPVILSSLGVFNNDPPVIFLGVTVSPDILDLHALVHRLFHAHGQGPRAYFLPGRWNPHCTLAPAIEPTKLARAMAFLTEMKLPLVGSIERLGIIDTPAEVELEAIDFCRR